MEISPQLQKTINDALVLLIPVLVSALTAWITGWKTRKDMNALHQAKRVIENEIGIKTNIKNGVMDVTRVSVSPRPVSQDPQRIDQGQGPSGAA